MIEKIKKGPHLIEEILADFGFYKNPKIIKQEFQSLVDIKSANMEGVEKYRGLLSNIRYAWQKTLKYEKYFTSFYASDGAIEDFEALSHHIHAYLQDMDTLKNKLKVFLDVLKKDLKKTASNKKEVVAFIDAGIEKTFEVFDGVTKHRHPHVHDGMRFMDGDLLEAENSHFTIEMLDNPLLDGMLNQEYKPEFIAEPKKKKKESFETAKTRWIEMARHNSEQTSGYLESLLSTIRPSLYQLLKIQSIAQAIKKAKK